MGSIETNFGQRRESSTNAETSVSIVGGVIAPRPSPLDARAVDVTVSNDGLRVALADGRVLIAPLAWFPRLIEASDRERGEFELIGGGRLIHWPAVDEDIDVPNLLRR